MGKLVIFISTPILDKMRKFCLGERNEEFVADFLGELVRFSYENSLSGNLWQNYLTFYLITNENPFTLSRERKRIISEDTIFKLAKNDIKLIYEMFFMDADVIEDMVSDEYKVTNSSKIISNLSNKLATSKNFEEFFDVIIDYYSKYGVGDLSLHGTYRFTDDGKVKAIAGILDVSLDDLIGLESQKQELLKNTRAFIENRPFNNCLLYGDAGTGKSTSIKAISNQFYNKGLRIIEVYKHQLHHLSKLITYIKNRNYKFIIYMDDLSFEEHELEYKYLKAIIEGGLENRPDNIVIYATSNRRTLIKETFGSRNEDLNKHDAMQEKKALLDRFGLCILYPSSDMKEYTKIVLALKKRYNITLDDEELLAKAKMWQVSHGGMTGRSAMQLLDYLRS